MTVSRKLWDLDWNARLPMNLGTDCTLRVARPGEIENFAASHFENVYGPATDKDWLIRRNHPSRTYFYEALADCFILECHGQAIGILVFNATDWSSYYLRNITILPEYQGRGIYKAVLRKVIEILRTLPIERLEVEVAVINRAALKVLANQGFILTGTTISERWGHLCRYTYFLNAENEHVFSKQFFVQSKFSTGRIRKEEP